VSEDNPIRVFVAHNFQQSDDYLRVFEFLESMERFFYLNVSKPEDMPEKGGMDAIKETVIRIEELHLSRYRVSRPDVDNLEKQIFEAIEDAGIVKDDAQIACVIAEKVG